MRTIEPNPTWSPYPIGRITDIDRDASFFLTGLLDPSEVKAMDVVLEMGCAPTERASLPFIEHETSDGIPTAIGDEEVTKPAHAPRTSTAVFTESARAVGDRCREDCIGRCVGCEPVRYEGMRW